MTMSHSVAFVDKQVARVHLGLKAVFSEALDSWILKDKTLILSKPSRRLEMHEFFKIK